MPSTLDGRAQRQRQPWPPWGAKRPCIAAMLVVTRRSLICSLSLQKLKMSAPARLCRLHKLQPARLRHVLASSGRCDEASGLRSRVLSHSCGITNVISTSSGSGSFRPSTSSPLPFAPARTAVQLLVILESRDGDAKVRISNLQIVGLSERELVGWPQGSLDGLHLSETGTRVAVPPILSIGACARGTGSTS